jgi:membrane-bound lytic murein transglycosylase F
MHPVLSSFGRHISDNKYSTFLEGKEVRALVNIKGGMYLKQGHPVGFHFDLLNRFAGHQRCSVNIKPVLGGDPWSDLLSGKVDILVVDSQKDTIPDEFSDKVISSVDLNHHEQVWVVMKENYQMLENLNYWFSFFRQSKEYKQLLNSYYRKYSGVSYAVGPVSVLSPYDKLIKEYSKSIGWDWRLLAALIYQESKFSMTAKSSRGAQGLMQVRSATAKQFEIDNVFDPEQNIKAGTLFIKRLQRLYSQPDIDSVNRIKFTLAAYNAGEGRLEDIRQFAIHKGVNHNDWDSLTEVVADMRYKENIPEGVTKLGSFKGNETLKYVEEVISRYEDYKVLVR